MSVEVRVGRIALAFVCAGIVAVVGVTLSVALYAVAANDARAGELASIIPIFGLPVFVMAVVVGMLAYGGLRLVGRVSGRAAIVTGSLVGGGAAALLRIPSVPPWSAALVGAAAGWVWWQVIQDAIPERVT